MTGEQVQNHLLFLHFPIPAVTCEYFLFTRSFLHSISILLQYINAFPQHQTDG